MRKLLRSLSYIASIATVIGTVYAIRTYYRETPTPTALEDHEEQSRNAIHRSGVMILSDSSNEATLQSGTSISIYALENIASELGANGYRVITREVAESRLGIRIDERTPAYSSAEKLSSVRTMAQLRAQYVVFYRIFPRMDERKNITVEISGGIFNLNDAAFIGGIGPHATKFPAPAECSDSLCITAITREKIIHLATMLGKEAAVKLDNASAILSR